MSNNQQIMCDRHGVRYCPPEAGSRVGAALQTIDLKPLNGMRIAPNDQVCGWYLWGGGEASDTEDFFQPVCIEHLTERYPTAIPFLGLPPGWRFLTDGEYVDVWYDDSLLRVDIGQQPTDGNI